LKLEALWLVLVSASFHALRDYLIKRATTKLLFLSWYRLCALVILLPFFFQRLALPITPATWVYLLVRSALDAAYIYTLAGAYEEGDLSLVYPIARSAPIFVLVWSTLVWHQPLPPAGIVGILVVAFGAYVLQLRGLSARALAAPVRAILRSRAIRLGWITALLVAANSLIDDHVVEVVDPVVYLFIFVGISSVLYVPYLFRCGWPSIRDEWQAHWKHILPAAVLGAGGYLLALLAFRIEHVGYVTALRQASIIFGVLLGTILLREPYGRVRIVGSLVMFAGMILIFALG
jgi:drug/metabolite transporter (DMT)-like permease